MAIAAFKDYYQTLGLARDADEAAIRRAFRKLAAKHHPDKNPGDAAAEERFKEINEAYTVLSDPEKRRVYDRYGSAGPQAGFPGGGFQGGFPGGGSFYSNVSPEEAAGFSDFFRSLFGGGFAGESPFAGASRSVPVRPAEAKLQVELERAFHGGPMSVRIDGRAFEVTIPAGVRPGAKLRLRGGAPGGGDLVLQIEHAPHGRYRLEGSTLHALVDVPDFVAVLGGEVALATLEGDVSLSIPPGTQTGRKLRLRGRGWPASKDEERGDLVAELRVRIPTHVSALQKQAYETLRDLATQAPSDAD